MENQLQVIKDERHDQSVFVSQNSFEHAQRVAKMLSSSNLIPKEFQGNIQNTMIALEMSNRIGASPLMVMQNLYIVHGKPSWSSTFIIAAINATKKFTPLRFDVSGEGNAKGCIAWANEIGTNERLESPRVSIQMAIDEGWMNKNGSKWKTMPELMLRYRAATFFGRLYAPEVLMGMHTMEEVVDVTEKMTVLPADEVAKEIEDERVTNWIENAKTKEQLLEAEPGITTEAQRDLFNNKLNELQ